MNETDNQRHLYFVNQYFNLRYDRILLNTK